MVMKYPDNRMCLRERARVIRNSEPSSLTARVELVAKRLLQVGNLVDQLFPLIVGKGIGVKAALRVAA